MEFNKKSATKKLENLPKFWLQPNPNSLMQRCPEYRKFVEDMFSKVGQDVNPLNASASNQPGSEV